MIKSMTGYGRAESDAEGRGILVEIKSVNHRYFEFSSRTTRGYNFLDEKLKSYVQSKVSRGKVDVFVTIEALEDAAAEVKINHSLADGYVKALRELRDTYGQPVMDQLHCFVGNQWKKSFDTPETRVVCRLTGSIFAVGCLDADGKQLAEEMQNLYRQMPRECITTTGMMRRVPFTLSCGAAGLEDVPAKNWQALYELCDARLREAQNAGGDQMRAE